MKLSISVWFLIAGSAANAALPGAPLSGAREQVQFMANSHRAIPRILSAPAAFDTDVFEMLEGQRAIRDRVEHLPAYNRLLAQRPDPLLFDVDVAGARVESEVISPSVLAAWRHELSSALDEVLSHGEIPSTRTEFARIVDANIKEFLRVGLPVDGENIRPLVQIRILALLDHNHDADQDLGGLRHWIGHLGEGDLDLFREQERVRTGLQGSPFDKATLAKVVKSVRDHVTEIGKQKVPVISTFTGKMTIEDVPPDLATMRGFFGDDCATKYSFFYPNSPLERTFYIYDEHGAPLAYAAGTHVTFEGRPAFYLHTINGPKITVAQTDEVLRAFDSLKARLGAQVIVLPIPQRIDENMNYSPIKGAYNLAIVGGKRGSVAYRDSEVRWALNELTEAHYDREDANGRGVLYSPRPRAVASAKATVAVHPYAQATSLKAFSGAEVSRIDVLMLAYGLTLSNRADAAARVLEIYEIPISQLHELNDLLDNKARLTIVENRRAIDQFVVKIGYDILSHPLVVYSNYFYRGALFASDALAPANREATITAVMGLINSGDIQAAARVIAVNPKAFDESAPFRDLVAELPVNATGPLFRAGLDPKLFANQIAVLKPRLSSATWWEAANSAIELSVLAPRVPAFYADILSALRASTDDRASVRMALILLRAGPHNTTDWTFAATTFGRASSLTDAKLSEEEEAQGNRLIADFEGEDCFSRLRKHQE